MFGFEYAFSTLHVDHSLGCGRGGGVVGVVGQATANDGYVAFTPLGVTSWDIIDRANSNSHCTSIKCCSSGLFGHTNVGCPLGNDEVPTMVVV